MKRAEAKGTRLRTTALSAVARRHCLTLFSLTNHRLGTIEQRNHNLSTHYDSRLSRSTRSRSTASGAEDMRSLLSTDRSQQTQGSLLGKSLRRITSKRAPKQPQPTSESVEGNTFVDDDKTFPNPLADVGPRIEGTLENTETPAKRPSVKRNQRSQKSHSFKSHPPRPPGDGPTTSIVVDHASVALSSIGGGPAPTDHQTILSSSILEEEVVTDEDILREAEESMQFMERELPQPTACRSAPPPPPYQPASTESLPRPHLTLRKPPKPQRVSPGTPACEMGNVQTGRQWVCQACDGACASSVETLFVICPQCKAIL